MTEKENTIALWTWRDSFTHSIVILQQMRHEMELLEGWMSIREPQLKEKNMGENIAIVEELIRRQEDFEKTVDAQDEKFRAITRRTKVGF